MGAPARRLAAAGLACLWLLPLFGAAFIPFPHGRPAARPAPRRHPLSTTSASSLADLQGALQQDGPGLLLDVSGFGLLSLTGEDRLRFLHNQLTNTFTDAQPGTVLEASYTTALGRCIDLVTVLLLPEEALILASPNRVDVIEQTMNKYIFPLDRVRVLRKPTAGVFALVGAGVSGASVVGEELPVGQCKVLQGGKMVAWAGTGLALPGVMVAAFEEQGAEALVAAAGGKGMVAGGMAEWETLRVAQGRPFPDKELTAEVTPLEAGLYHTVHLEKGCYLGQETIAKVANNKGERQRLYGLQFPSSLAPAMEEGARLVEAEGGARAGVVTSVLKGEGRALAYIRKTVARPVGARLLVEGAGAEAVTVVELPYATREEAQSASGVRAAKAGAGDGGAGAEGGKETEEAKAAEAARKAAKLEEMRKRLEAFQAKQKQQ